MLRSKKAERKSLILPSDSLLRFSLLAPRLAPWQSRKGSLVPSGHESGLLAKLQLQLQNIWIEWTRGFFKL